jgi:hypothetical protein
VVGWTIFIFEESRHVEQLALKVVVLGTQRRELSYYGGDGGVKGR